MFKQHMRKTSEKILVRRFLRRRLCFKTLKVRKWDVYMYCILFLFFY